MKFYARIFREKYLDKIQFSWKPDKNNSYYNMKPQWTDFHEILYKNISRKYLEKILFSWKSDKNNSYYTWEQLYIRYLISLVSS